MRRLQDRARDAFAEVEAQILAEVNAAVPPAVVQKLVESAYRPRAADDATNLEWLKTRADETREPLDHPLADRAGHVDRQAFVGELVHDRQALDLLALGGGVEHEVVGPDEVGVGWRQRSRTARGDAPARPAPWQLQLRLAPEPVRAVHAGLVALAAQEDADASIAVARVLRRQRLMAVITGASLAGRVSS